ncbi:hypothetical protein B0H19DRAFT_1243209 [Mycena capillaripes]|nr:hypothetical protein B0H19DRAFT_1243209 [Mycena capillaripes]
MGQCLSWVKRFLGIESVPVSTTGSTSDDFDAVKTVTVFSITLQNLPGTVVNPAILATPGRFRLFDVSAFLDGGDFCIVEYAVPIEPQTDILEIFGQIVPLYAAISYPWRDLQEDTVQPSFSVAGAEHADPISISVLTTACAAVRAYGYSMLWLDRLCILQSNKQDKVWQIQRMHRIYKSCSLCVVLPGGLVRLARLDEPTTWIYRAWTLQEAVAPGIDKLKLVFRLSHLSYEAFLDERCATEGYPEAYSSFLRKSSANETSRYPHGRCVDKVLEDGRSAAADMKTLTSYLSAMDAAMRFHAPEISYDYTKSPVRILPVPETHMMALAVKLRGSRLWTSAYTRSSSRPVDMVFSLMALFDVQIDVARFGKNDRLQATIAMLQALMRRRGAVATWLFIAPGMTPSRELSILPQMPETSESGRAYIETPDGGRVLAFEAVRAKGTNFWSSEGAPSGEMTDSGYFVFWAMAAPMLDVDPQCLIHGSFQSATRADFNDCETWAVVVGRFKNLNRNPDTWKIQGSQRDGPKPQGLEELTLMLVERHGYDLYHRVGMEREIDERQTRGWRWTFRRFQVGGPGRGERKRFKVCPEGPNYASETDAPEEDQTGIAR